LLTGCASILSHSIVVPDGTKADQPAANVKDASILALFVALCLRVGRRVRGVGGGGAWANCGYRAVMGVGVWPLHSRCCQANGPGHERNAAAIHDNRVINRRFFSIKGDSSVQWWGLKNS
jgi:hypothetical protein